MTHNTIGFLELFKYLNVNYHISKVKKTIHRRFYHL